MSGGSWDYLYQKLFDAGLRLKKEPDQLRQKLGNHLLVVGEAMEAIEWVDSMDWGPGDEIPAIKKALAIKEQA